MQEPPFVEMRIQSFGPNFTGYCIDMLDEIAKQMNFQYDIYNASEYGRLNGNTWVGAVGEVAYKVQTLSVKLPFSICIVGSFPFVPPPPSLVGAYYLHPRRVCHIFT